MVPVTADPSIPTTFAVTSPTVTFAFDWPWWDADDVIVRVDGVALDPSAFTVDGSGDGGTVTLNASVDDVTVEIDRLVRADLTAGLSVTGALNVDALNSQLARLTARDQDIVRTQDTAIALAIETEAVTQVAAAIEAADISASGLLTPMAFGCAGDGLTNDAANLVLACAYANLHDLVLDGLGRTYKINTPIPAWARKARNITIDMSAVTATTTPYTGGSARRYGLVCTGTDHFAVGYATNAFSTTRARFDETVPVTAGAEAAYATGRLCLVYENAAWGTSGAKQSEFVYVDSTSSGSLALQGPLQSAYSTSATIRPCGTTEVEQRGVRIIGGGSGLAQVGITIAYHRRAYLDIDTLDCEHAGIELYSVAHTTGRASGANCSRSGFGYAFSVFGCGIVSMSEVTGRNCRHIVTHGAGPGSSLTRRVVYGSIVGRDMLDATLDGHPSVVEGQVGNLIHHGRIGSSSAGDGIVWQGSRLQVGQAVINGVKRHGVLIQPFGDGDVVKGWIRFGSLAVRGPSTAGYAFAYDDTNAAGAENLSTLQIDHIDSQTGKGVYVNCAENDVETVKIGGGRVSALDTANNSSTTPTAGLHIRNSANGGTRKLRVRDLECKTVSVQTNTRSICIDGDAAHTVDAHISACLLDGGKYGLDVLQGAAKCDDVTYANQVTATTVTGTGGTITTVTYA